jgi:sugar phosphate isomerase/epimerase
MDKHWNNYCTMSIVHFMAFPETIRGEGPLVETVSKIAADPFFGAIEIGWIKNPADRQAVKRVIDAAHIKVGHGGQTALLLQKLDLNSLDETERTRAVEQVYRSIDEAAETGAERVAILSGPDPSDADRPKAFDALVKSIKAAAAYGQDKGIAITLETFDRSIDKKCLIGPSDIAARLSETIRQDYPSFGLMYDLSHMPLLYETADYALGTLKDHLVHIHVGNGVRDQGVEGYGDLHPRFGLPGGCNDVAELTEFIRTLVKVGYLSEDKPVKPWVGFEVKPQFPGETSELIIAGTQRAWQEAWARA